MSYTRKVAFNTFAQIIGKVVGTAVSLVTTAILFRYFGIEGMGKYTTVFAFVSFFSIFADFGLQWALIRELAVTGDQKKVFKNVFALRICLAALIHGLSFALVWLFNYPLDVKIGVGIINFAWFFITVNSVLVGVFLNNYRLDLSVSSDVVGRVVILGVVYFMSKTGATFGQVLTAYLAGDAINFFVNLYLVRKFVRLGFEFDFSVWKNFAIQAFPIGVVLVFHFIYFKIDSIMLSLMRGMIDVGIYGTAYKLLEVLQTVPAMFLGAAFPLMTKYIEAKDVRISSAFQKQFDFLVILAVPIVAITFVLAGPIISFIAGSRGAEFVSASTISVFSHPITSVTCLKILIFSVGINFISSLYSYMLVSLGRQKSMMLPTAGFAVFNVLLNLVLISRVSYLGAAAATVATEIVVAVTMVYLVRRYIKVELAYRRSLKTIFAGVLMGAIVYFLNLLGLNLFANLVLGTLVYAALIFAFGSVNLDMIKSIILKSEA